MSTPTPATLLFDVGKTHKKWSVVGPENRVLDAEEQVFPEIADDDGFPCDDLAALTRWLPDCYERLRRDPRWRITEVQFMAYGASFVHLGADGQAVAPLYNYLKPMPGALENRFYDMIGREFGQSKAAFAAATCSPAMGMLNSGLQLYFLKYARPEIFQKIHTSLHLPQYLSWLLTGKKVSDYTSLGCHTALWDFARRDYHGWVYREGLDRLLAPLSGGFVERDGLRIGRGLHDSSATLLRYAGRDNFLLISTGTWVVSLNPFNNEPLTEEQLRRDCLCYLSPEGRQTKASRVFLGKEHEYQCGRIAAHFGVKSDFYHETSQESGLPPGLKNTFFPACMHGTGPFPEQAAGEWDLSPYPSAEAAYGALLHGLVDLLKVSIGLIDNGVSNYFVEGGFVRNRWFMELLRVYFPEKTVHL